MEQLRQSFPQVPCWKKLRIWISKDVHPSVIVDGYTAAAEQALKLLQKIAVKVDVDDKDVMIRIARTSMDSKLVSEDSPTLSQIVVNAIKQIAEEGGNDALKVDLDNNKGGKESRWLYA